MRRSFPRLLFRSPVRMTVIAAFLVTVFTVLGACSPRRVVDVRFFYRELCPDCETYKLAAGISTTLFAIDRSRRDLVAESHNLIDPEAYPILLEEIDRRSMPDISRSIPLLFVDGSYFVGYDDIRSAVETLRRK